MLQDVEVGVYIGAMVVIALLLLKKFANITV